VILKNMEPAFHALRFKWLKSAPYNPNFLYPSKTFEVSKK
jgi:hypothetical protein